MLHMSIINLEEPVADDFNTGSAGFLALTVNHKRIRCCFPYEIWLVGGSEHFYIFVWHLPSSTLAEFYGLWMVYITIANWWFGTMEFYDFPYIGNVIIPTDELIFFRGVGNNHQPDEAVQFCFNPWMFCPIIPTVLPEHLNLSDVYLEIGWRETPQKTTYIYIYIYWYKKWSPVEFCNQPNNFRFGCV